MGQGWRYRLKVTSLMNHEFTSRCTDIVYAHDIASRHGTGCSDSCIIHPTNERHAMPFAPSHA